MAVRTNQGSCDFQCQTMEKLLEIQLPEPPLQKREKNSEGNSDLNPKRLNYFELETLSSLWPSGNGGLAAKLILHFYDKIKQTNFIIK